jgi:C4-dicarboxylate-specific signal transduction histidine kinase
MPHLTREQELLVAASRSSLRGGAVRWLVHEIRNPLQVITLTTELLELDGEKADLDLVRMLRAGARQLAAGFHVLDQLLERPPLETAAGPVAVFELLRFIEHLYSYDREPGVLRIEGNPMELPAIAGMPTRLSHALLNVVQNAKEAVAKVPDGQVTVEAASAEGGVRITVHDNGPGVAEAIRATMFEPFVTTKTVSVLSGLGLPVSRWLTEQFGGSLEFDAGATSGARFVFHFPAWHG